MANIHDITRDQWMLRGRKEGLELGKLETARNLKATGIDVEIISQCTGLTLEQIAKL